MEEVADCEASGDAAEKDDAVPCIEEDRPAWFWG